MVETDAGQLRVEFFEDVRLVKAGQRLSFGRSADLVIDEDNQTMHRVIGVFESHGPSWWVRNLGKSVIRLHDRESKSTAEVAPGSQQALPWATTVVRVLAGPTPYEFEAHTEAHLPPVSTFQRPGDETRVEEKFSLNEPETLLVLALAEPILREPMAKARVPSNKAVIRRLGWRRKQYERKLDYICEKLAEHGIRGVHEPGGNARNRRQILVEYCIAEGLVDDTRLPLLDETD